MRHWTRSRRCWSCQLLDAVVEHRFRLSVMVGLGIIGIAFSVVALVTLVVYPDFR